VSHFGPTSCTSNVASSIRIPEARHVTQARSYDIPLPRLEICFSPALRAIFVTFHPKPLPGAVHEVLFQGAPCRTTPRGRPRHCPRWPPALNKKPQSPPLRSACTA